MRKYGERKERVVDEDKVRKWRRKGKGSWKVKGKKRKAKYGSGKKGYEAIGKKEKGCR